MTNVNTARFMKPPATPRPMRRNAFKAGSMLHAQFNAILKAYAEGHKDVIRDGVRCMGNGWACAFWRGYDLQPPYLTPPATLAWACYRAGQSARITDNEKGVYVPGKTNSIVGLR